jgi:ATP-dependent exoDNAse (exonuclease V) beta subunit
LAVDDLRENHRSLSEILSAVSSVLDGQAGIEPRPLIAARGTGATVERLVGQGDDAAEVEASLVASRIHELVSGGDYEYRDIAILVRTMRATQVFERALDRFGINFLVSGGRTFLEAREIRDLMMLLAALVNPLDQIAVIGVLRSPFAGLDDEHLFRIGSEGWQKEFEELFGKLRRMAGFAAPDLLLARALDESGYTARISGRARANVEKYIAYTRREHHNRPLAELLEDLESLRTMQSEAEAPPADAGNVVRLMSVHAAKGLEFPVVFVSALHQGPDRRKPIVAFSASAGLGVRWRNPQNGKGQSDPSHALVTEELKRKEEAEENRLLYVAMTRARDRLFLSYADRGRPSNWRKLVETAIPEVTCADHVIDAANTGAGADRPLKDPPEAREIEHPVITGQYDSASAVTAITGFHACPRKYLLSSIAKPANRRRGSGGIETGLAVHRILAGEEDESTEAAELATRFRSSEWGQRAARATRVEREFDFLLYIEDIVLRGQIDLWFEEAGELVVVDYKTDREEPSSEAYSLQLRLYALALEKYAGRLPDRAVLYYVRADKPVEVDLNAAGHE